MYTRLRTYIYTCAPRINATARPATHNKYSNISMTCSMMSPKYTKHKQNATVPTMTMISAFSTERMLITTPISFSFNIVSSSRATTTDDRSSPYSCSGIIILVNLGIFLFFTYVYANDKVNYDVCHSIPRNSSSLMIAIFFPCRIYFSASRVLLDFSP